MSLVTYFMASQIAKTIMFAEAQAIVVYKERTRRMTEEIKARATIMYEKKIVKLAEEIEARVIATYQERMVCWYDSNNHVFPPFTF